MSGRGTSAGGPTTDTRRSACPVACALEVVGDRWTLLVIRDLFAGKKRYGEFLASAEKIPTNILADRLKRLGREGLVSSVPYSEHPPRVEYRLTPEGRELGRALEALAAWGLRHFPGTTRTVWPAADPDDPPAKAGQNPSDSGVLLGRPPEPGSTPRTTIHQRPVRG